MKRRSALGRVAVPLLLAAFPHLSAQAPPVFPAWPYDASAPRPPSPGVAFLATARWQILLSAPRSYELLPRGQAVERETAACQLPLRLSDQDVRSLDAARPWAEFDSASSSMSGLSVAVLPQIVNLAGCAHFLSTDPAFLARGVRLVQGASGSHTKSASGAELLVSGEHVRSVAYQLVDAIDGVPRGAPVDTSPQLRFFVPADRLVPLHGSYPPMDVRVSIRDGSPAERVAVPSGALDVVWNALLPERIDRRVEDALDAPVNVPPPGDARLHQAWSLIGAGRRREGSAIIFRRLGEAPASTSDKHSAMVSLSAVLLESADTAAARVVAARLTALSPCLSLSSAASAPLRALIENSRPPARCDVESPLLTLLSGALLPGLGQLRTGHRVSGSVILATTVALIVASGATLNGANAAYARYNASRSVLGATDNYAHATQLRHAALAFGTAAGAVWAASAIKAAVTEWKHASDVGSVRNYGRRT
jgi:hypothetical protein